MKLSLVFLAAVALCGGVPRQNKLFHEYFEDFLQLINDEVGHDLEHLMSHYVEFEEFRQTVNFLKTSGFRDLIHEMESQPEFIAVVTFLENNNIDIMYFLERLEDMLSITETSKSRHEISGTDFNSFLKDMIDEFPKEKLNTLFQEIIANDKSFEDAISNLYSKEWLQLLNDLWESEKFKKEAQTLAEHGIDIELLIVQIKAIMGQ